MASNPVSVVTGGAGFLGSHLTDRLLAKGHRVLLTVALLLFASLLQDSAQAIEKVSRPPGISTGQRVGIDTKFGDLCHEGVTALQNKQYDLAISRFTAALQMNPDNKNASVIYDRRAEAYLQNNELSKAMDDANASIKLNPRFYSPYIERGVVYRRRGDFDKAISEYDIALGLNPNSVPAYNNRGVAYSNKGEGERAIRDFNEAIRLDSNYTDAYQNRGTTYEEMGNLDRAVADYGEAIRRNPKVKYAHYNRGNLYFHRGDFDKAISDLNEAIRRNDDTADAYRARGKAYLAKGNNRAAYSDFAKAEQAAAPTNAEGLNSVAWFKATCPDGSQRNGREAIRQATKACDLSGWKNGGFIDTLATAYAETGDFDRAVKYEEQALNMKSVLSKTRKDLQEHLGLFQEHKPYREELKPRPSS